MPDVKALPEAVTETPETDGATTKAADAGFGAEAAQVPGFAHASGTFEALDQLNRYWDGTLKTSAALASVPIVPPPGAANVHQLKRHTQQELGQPNPKVLGPTMPTTPTTGQPATRPGQMPRFSQSHAWSAEAARCGIVDVRRSPSPGHG